MYTKQMRPKNRTFGNTRPNIIPILQLIKSFMFLYHAIDFCSNPKCTSSNSTVLYHVKDAKTRVFFEALYSCLKIESAILSWSRKIRVRENPYSNIFHAVLQTFSPRITKAIENRVNKMMHFLMHYNPNSLTAWQKEQNENRLSSKSNK